MRLAAVLIIAAAVPATLSAPTNQAYSARASALSRRSWWSSIGNAVDSVVSTVSNAASSVGSTVDNAAQTVKQGVVSAADTVGSTVKTAAQDTAQGVEGAAKDVGRTVSDASTDVGDDVETAAKDVGKTVEGAAEDVGKEAETIGADAMEDGGAELAGEGALDCIPGLDVITIPLTLGTIIAKTWPWFPQQPSSPSPASPSPASPVSPPNPQTSSDTSSCDLEPPSGSNPVTANNVTSPFCSLSCQDCQVQVLGINSSITTGSLTTGLVSAGGFSLVGALQLSCQTPPGQTSFTGAEKLVLYQSSSGEAETQCQPALPGVTEQLSQTVQLLSNFTSLGNGSVSVAFNLTVARANTAFSINGAVVNATAATPGGSLASVDLQIQSIDVDMPGLDADFTLAYSVGDDMDIAGVEAFGASLSVATDLSLSVLNGELLDAQFSRGSGPGPNATASVVGPIGPAGNCTSLASVSADVDVSLGFKVGPTQLPISTSLLDVPLPLSASLSSCGAQAQEWWGQWYSEGLQY